MGTFRRNFSDEQEQELVAYSKRPGQSANGTQKTRIWKINV
jgi:hypothetical protein